MDPKVIRPLADELRAVVALLRQGSASARGVALAERLLTDGGSALYGHDLVALREELGRLRYLLGLMREVN
jgi:hypothetical protein